MYGRDLSLRAWLAPTILSGFESLASYAYLRARLNSLFDLRLSDSEGSLKTYLYIKYDNRTEVRVPKLRATLVLLSIVLNYREACSTIL